MPSLKKLLVTGGAGFIGSEFCAQRIADGNEVVVLDALTYAGSKENLEWIDDPDNNLEFITGNICDTDLIIRLLKEHNIDAVVNFAAETHVDNSINLSAPFINTNINGTYSMLEACRSYWNALKGRKKQDFRYVQISTDEVYGSLGEVGKFSEESNITPNSPYSASKAAGDHLVRAWYVTYGLPTIITNCSNNYGPRQYREKLIPTIIRHALAGEPLPIYGDGKNIRDWIHVGDHSRGIYLALSKGIPGETYCFGGNAEMENIEIVKLICKILDELKPLKSGSYSELISYVEDRPGHDRRYAIDDTKAIKKLGFKRLFDFEKGIEETVKWYLDNKSRLEA